MAAETALLEVGAMFAAIGAVGFLAGRLDLSPIPFYILVGIALNESVLGAVGLPAVSNGEFVQVGAELGIVFLLFFLGLEFNLDRLLADRTRIGTAGVIDLVVNFGVGLGVGWLLFGSLLPALLIAGVVYISSSAIITKSLLDLGWIANPESSPLLGVLVFEDLVVAVYLAVVTALVAGGGDVGAAARAIGIAFAFILFLLAIVAAGTALFERLLDTPSSEYFILRAVGVTVLLAGAALAVGVSEAVAAFFVGMAFSATEYVHDLETALSSIRDVFAAVFFFWIGLVTDPFVVVGAADVILLLVVLTAPAKLLSGFYGGRAYALNDRRSLRVGLAMVTRGEFSLIIAAVALSGAGSTLPVETAETIYAAAVGYVLVMSALGTTLMGASGRFERFLPS
ncbi:cation:proton antiporter [Haloplanus aerogenes]|uniref:CPA2 family monovalent cation:H+ antiporter-2 n=1 Tax=Haloplanus aerogenes TaxID=660522 RepID=A0A3M0D9T0_9EURY|nr:cation:proton antiporter [Haloplanus aerogenes]AZH26189.1 cation:proton antiporter [Haloplanus aerogenes]RMB18358.1 CPA2 family monovalent cation:H+ antiporter-2 [Haloplanus aerogenes]